MKFIISTVQIAAIVLLVLPGCKQRDSDSAVKDYRISPTGLPEAPASGNDLWPIPAGSGHVFSASDEDRILNEMKRVKDTHKSPDARVAACHAATGEGNALTTWPAVASHYYCLLAQGRGCFTMSVKDAAQAGSPISYRRAYEVCTTTGYSGTNYQQGDKLDFDQEGAAVFLQLMMQSPCTYSEVSQKNLLKRWYKDFSPGFVTPYGKDSDGIPKRGTLVLQTACPSGGQPVLAPPKEKNVACEMHAAGGYAVAIRKSDSVKLGVAYFSSRANCDRAVSGAKNGLICTMHSSGDFAAPTMISNGTVLGSNYFTSLTDCISHVAASKNGIVCTYRQGDFGIPTRVNDGKILGEFYFHNMKSCAVAVENSQPGKVCTSYNDNVHFVPWDIRNSKALQAGYIKGLDACNSSL